MKLNLPPLARPSENDRQPWVEYVAALARERQIAAALREWIDSEIPKKPPAWYRYDMETLLEAIADQLDPPEEAANLVPCPTCGGQGWTCEPVPSRADPTIPEPSQEPCPTCDATTVVNLPRGARDTPRSGGGA